jgi:hypothetical protein
VEDKVEEKVEDKVENVEKVEEKVEDKVEKVEDNKKVGIKLKGNNCKLFKKCPYSITYDKTIWILPENNVNIGVRDFYFYNTHNILPEKTSGKTIGLVDKKYTLKKNNIFNLKSKMDKKYIHLFYDIICLGFINLKKRKSSLR